MTFYEAALRVLESEGRPLHFLEITEKSIQLSLLSHIGKTPEVTMLSRLAAMARRTRDRKVIVTAKDTFALTDWSLSEDVEALAQTGVMEPHPEEELPPLRPVERHPEPRTDNVRASGRGTERKRRRDEGDEERGGRRKRFPPLPEVVFEILSEADAALRTDQLIERAKGKELCAEETTVEAVLTALLEDNQRRIDAGRRPQYAFNQETGEVSLERAGAPSEAPPLELQAAFAQALGIPLEGGRPVLGKPAAAGEPLVDEALITTARTALKDARRAVARGLRKRLGDADVGTFEKSVVKMMHGLGFRELKVAKRSKEGPLLTARKREGSVELRYAVRMLKGAPGIDRKTVQELRRDLGHYSAQVGLLVSAGEVRGDARSEAQASGSLVMLWCGDALGEKFLEAKTAVTVTQVELYDIDERFFEAAKLDAEEAQRRREERKSEKQAREEGGGEVEAAATTTERAERPERSDRQERSERRRDRQRERAEARDAAQSGAAEGSEAKASPVAPAPPPAAGFTPASEEDESEEGDDEGEDEDLEAASAFVGGAKEGAEAGTAEGNASDRKRRRRRRRGRRGRGSRGAEGAPAGEGGAPGEAAASAGEAGATTVAAVAAGEGNGSSGGVAADAGTVGMPGEGEGSSGGIAAPSPGGSVTGETVALAGEALPVTTEAHPANGEATATPPSVGNAWQAGEAAQPESDESARARAEAAKAASDAETPVAAQALPPEEAPVESSSQPAEVREVHEAPVSPGTDGSSEGNKEG
ncbi:MULTISPECIES: HTH domain-containing protein [unclassified Corallococcus]|uniref:HTH domain-containing protein n=1 Tax=unclassified Corallococcus TaxID=2685029 RepID=UPI001A8D9354|nr:MULTISPECIES: HTH domain-containing protein [unclassified Corallococcus]MBN9684971.1 restriction endonuclease [Corallococcus sp. NCSPR001]WAS83567.1 HTH domain-containing protein [Corallococcus sp. NCRR]